MKRLLALIIIGSIGCGDCGDDPTVLPETDAGSEPDVTTQEDTGIQTPDVSDPASNFPAFVEVEVTPGRTTYATDQNVSIDVTVYDAFGDVAIYDTEVEITAGDATLETDGTYTLTVEGPVTFTACTLEVGQEGAAICNADTIIVDNAPPKLTLVFPPAGAELDSTMFPTINVSGTVEDTYGTPRVFVNGVESDVSPDGTFESVVTPDFGINHIQVEATDGLSDRFGSIAADVMWAHDYLETTNGEPDVFFSDGLQFRLGQSMLDDGVAPTLNADGSISFGDVSDILKLVIETIDTSDFIPDPVVDSSPTFFLRVPSVDLGSAVSQIEWRDDGIEVFLRLPNAQLNTLGQIQVNNQTLSLNGTIDASIAAVIDVSIRKPTALSPVIVNIDSVQVAVEDATSNFQSAEANAVFLIAAGALRTTIETLVVDLLTDSFLNELPAVFESLFEDLGDALESNSIPIDTGFGPPITLQLLGGLDQIALNSNSHMDVAARLRAQTDRPGIHDSRGIPLLDPNAQPTFFQSDIEIGLRLALVNGILSILWDSGILDIDISETIPIAVDQATLVAKLPPVVRPPAMGGPFTFVIEVGQLELSTDVLGRSDTYGIYLSTGINITLDAGGLSVNIGDQPTIRTWVISASEAQSLLTPGQLEGLIRTELWPEIQSALSNGISLPIPAFDLSSLGGVSASLSGATLEITGGRSANTRSGYTMIDGVLEGLIP